MGAPKVIIQTEDLSTRVPAFPGVYGGLVVASKKGPLVPTLVTSETDFLNKYTAEGYPVIGDDNSIWDALAYLEKSDKLWCNRAIGANYAYSTIELYSDDTYVGTNDGGGGSADPESESFVTDQTVLLYVVYPGAFGNDVKIKTHNPRVTHVISACDHANGCEYSADTVALDTDEYWQNGEQVKIRWVTREDETVNAPGDISGDEIAVSANVWIDGEPVQLTGADLPEPLVAATTYYTIAVDDSHISLALTPDNAMAGTAITLTDGGTGTFTIALETDALKLPITSPAGEIAVDTILYTICTNATYGSKIQLAISESDALAGEDVENIDIIEDPNADQTTGGVCGAFYLEPVNKVAETGAFKLEVYWKNEATPRETFILSRTEGSKDGFGRLMFIEDRLLASEYVRAYSNPGNGETPNATELPKAQPTKLDFDGGEDGDATTQGDFVTASDAFLAKTAYPMTVMMDGGQASTAITTYPLNLITIAETRLDCFAELSIPLASEEHSDYLNQIVNYKNNILNPNTSYAALGTPRIKMWDRWNARHIYVPCSGYFGAQTSYTGANWELWYPIGGSIRGKLNVEDVLIRFTEGEADLLYDNNINPIMFFSGRGIQINGQKTLLARESYLQRKNVQYLLIVIQPAIAEALEDYKFYFNDETTRAIVKSRIDSYMDGIKARRGVYDYYTQCDSENNLPTNIANNELIVWLFVKPTMAIEYIKFTTVITPLDMSFELAAEAV